MEDKIFYIDGLVSVVIPMYNSASYITPTIDSVLCQTYDKLEIVLVDDCSKDNSIDVVNEISKRDNRVKCFKQPTNKGAAEARNRGMLEAKGQYIAFLDSDDIWDKHKLEKQISFFKEKKAAFVFCAYDWIDENSQPVKGKIKIKEKVTYKDLMTKTLISTPTAIYDRNQLGCPLMPLRRTGQDYAYWLVLLKKADAYGIDEALVHVRRRAGSLSKNKFQHLKDIWETQTGLEHINKFSAFFHLIGYVLFTVKKRFF